jgi:hypothetical protein
MHGKVYHRCHPLLCFAFVYSIYRRFSERLDVNAQFMNLLLCELLFHFAAAP